MVRFKWAMDVGAEHSAQHIVSTQWMVVVVRVMRDTNDKNKEVGALVPVVELALSARKVNLPLKLKSWKTVGEHTGGGDGSPPCLCIRTHAAPLTEGRIRPHWDAHLFFFCIDCMKAKNTTLGSCPAFGFPSKSVETSLPSETIYFMGVRSYTLSVYFQTSSACFHTYSLSSLTQLLAWALSPILEMVHRSARR